VINRVLGPLGLCQGVLLGRTVRVAPRRQTSGPLPVVGPGRGLQPGRAVQDLERLLGLPAGVFGCQRLRFRPGQDQQQLVRGLEYRGPFLLAKAGLLKRRSGSRAPVEEAEQLQR
jgi:hypothetical protein